MHLRSISMKGFKSFPTRTKLEFGTGVSVIVGPNGSGKSNITDAVLWALGEQSPLAVRGQAMKDVIFAGAHGVKGANAAEVEVVIDNGDGALDIDFSEISIVRKLERDGEGEYRLNGARCRLVDVVEVLSDSGLGKEMHSVVSQGKVEQIVLSRPRERRLLIEEAAGLGKHRKRRRRAQLKLERTEENLSRALDVEREARSRLRPLKRQAEAAELHERLERQTLEARYSLSRDAARSARLALAEAEERARDRARRARRGRAAARRGGAGAASRPRRRSPPRRATASACRRGCTRRARRASGSPCGSSACASRPSQRASAASGGSGRWRCSSSRPPRTRTWLPRRSGPRTGSRRSSASWPNSTPGASSAWRASWSGLERELEGARRQGFRAGAGGRRAPQRPRGGRAGGGGRARGAPRRRARGGGRTRAGGGGGRGAGGGESVRARERRGGDGSAAQPLAERLHVEPGYELALAAVLGPRLTATVVNDRIEGERVLDAAGAERRKRPA